MPQPSAPLGRGLGPLLGLLAPRLAEGVVDPETEADVARLDQEGHVDEGLVLVGVR